jgi:hypothetical protein
VDSTGTAQTIEEIAAKADQFHFEGRRRGRAEIERIMDERLTG